jgi:hypothetical protein
MRFVLSVIIAILIAGSVAAQKGQGNQTPKEKVAQAKQLLKEAKKSLEKEGKYDCCIKGDCDRCALDHQNCNCAKDVKAGKAVCSDCYAGWQRGDGTVPDVDAKKVKLSSHSHEHH